MKRIDALRLGADDYPIRWDADSVEAVRACIDEDDDGTTASGSIDFAKREICLDPDCLVSPMNALHILFHEAGHMIDIALGLDLSEAQVDAMAFAWRSLMVQSGLISPEELTVAGVALRRKR
jgi:hypothetical protein